MFVGILNSFCTTCFHWWNKNTVPNFWSNTDIENIVWWWCFKPASTKTSHWISFWKTSNYWMAYLRLLLLCNHGLKPSTTADADLCVQLQIPADWTLSLTGISSWASGHGLWSGGHSPLYQDYYQTTLSTRNPTLCTKFKEKSRYAVTHILLKNVVHVNHNGNGRRMLVN